MKKKILFMIVVTIGLIFSYLGIQRYWLQKTELLPYMNLRSRGSSSCFIAFNVENKGQVYKVVMPNDMANGGLVRRKNFFLTVFYSLYMAEIIRHDLNIAVDDSLFSEIKVYTIDDATVNKFAKRDLLNDTLVLDKQSRLTLDLTQEEYNAVIYLFLRNGSNCCIQDLSGRVFVAPKWSRKLP